MGEDAGAGGFQLQGQGYGGPAPQQVAFLGGKGFEVRDYGKGAGIPSFFQCGQEIHMLFLRLDLSGEILPPLCLCAGGA